MPDSIPIGAVAEADRRAFLYGGTAVMLGGMMSLRSCTEAQRVQLAAVPHRAMAPSAPQPAPAKPAPRKPLTANPQATLGIDISTLPRPGQPLDVFHARLGGRDLDVKDYQALADRRVITASMIKTYTCLLVADGCTRRINAWSEFEDENPGAMDVTAATKPLIGFDDILTISKTDARLNWSPEAHAGRSMSVRECMKYGLRDSSNGCVQALAEHYGQALIDNRIEANDGAPGAAYRAFLNFANRHASESYGLSEHLHMVNPHGLPCYETLVDLDSFNGWQDEAKARYRFDKKDGHLKKARWDDGMAGVALGTDSGLCQLPATNTTWGFFDGPRVMAHWIARHEGLMEELFHRGNGMCRLDRHFDSLLVKTGSSDSAGGCLHGVARQGELRLYAMTCGNWPQNHRWAAFGETLNAYRPAAPQLPVATRLSRRALLGLARA